MTDLTCDVAIIGAGTAGLAAERAARAAGATTLLIDPAFAGTTCARVGCMPSKLLIAAGDAAHAARTAGTFGIDVPQVTVDGVAVMTRVRRLRDAFVEGVVDGLDDLPDGVAIRATARFTSATTLALDDGRTVAARATVIATGSHPAIPKPFEAVRDRVLTNESVFDMTELPRSLGVVGAGPLGLELAQAFARLGVAVTVFDSGTTLAGLDDEPEIEASLRAILSEEMDFQLGVELTAEAVDDGVRLSWDGGGRTVGRVLVATGRPPNLSELDLAAAGIELDDHGTPLFDRDTMRCGMSTVFIAGDADHDRAVLHEASDEGAIAGGNAARWPNTRAARRSVPFAIMFTDPPLATIGTLGEVTGFTDYAEQGRARMMATNRGLVRIHADRAEGRLTGATILAPGGEHLGHLLAWAIETGQRAADLLDRPFYHPTYEEGLRTALRMICKAAGTEPPTDRDAGNAAGG